MKRVNLGLFALLLVVATALSVPAASARSTKTCGPVTAHNGATTSPIHARHVRCATARRVTRRVVNRPNACFGGANPSCNVVADGIRFTCHDTYQYVDTVQCHAGRKYVHFAVD